MATEPTKPSVKKWLWIIMAHVVFAIFVFAFTAIDDYQIKKARLQPRFAPAVVDSLSFSVKPGERVVFGTADPVTGELCRYVVEWTKSTRESALQTSVHNFLGKGGVGGRIGGSHTTPWLNNNLFRGNEHNQEIHFVSVLNDGPDVVEFKVELVGYRQVFPQPTSE